MNKKRKIPTRLLSVALSISLTTLYFPIRRVAYAAETSTLPSPLDAAFSIPIYIQPFHMDKYNAIDLSKYIDSEKIMDALHSCTLSSRATEWQKLTEYDKLPVGEIHYRVQDDIWYNSTSNTEGGENLNTVDYDELPIIFDKTKNISGLSLPNGMNIEIDDIKPKKDSGRADIWKQEDNYTSLWEVKPPSYFNVNETKGEIQLAQYVFYGDDDYQFGHVGSPNAVQENNFQFEEILLCTDLFGSMFWFEYVTYDVKYYTRKSPDTLPTSLIIYSFTRDSVTGSPVQVKDKVTKDALERAKEALKKKIKETEPTGVPAPAHGLQPALDNATKEIPDTPKVPKTDRVIDET